MARHVVVLDCGGGDSSALCEALTSAGAEVELSSDYTRAMAADGLLVTGEGDFAAGVAALRAARGDWAVGRRLAGGRAVLGVDLGMQLLFGRARDRDGELDGLDEWPGTVEPLPGEPQLAEHRSGVEVPEGSRLFVGLPSDARFHFAHSHAVRTWELRATYAGMAAPAVAWSSHEGTRFVAAVENGPLCAVQFRPERSGDAGARLLANWVDAL